VGALLGDNVIRRINPLSHVRLQPVDPRLGQRQSVGRKGARAPYWRALHWKKEGRREKTQKKRKRKKIGVWRKEKKNEPLMSAS
jgi:hypothetical protein